MKRGVLIVNLEEEVEVDSKSSVLRKSDQHSPVRQAGNNLRQHGGGGGGWGEEFHTIVPAQETEANEGIHHSKACWAYLTPTSS